MNNVKIYNIINILVFILTIQIFVLQFSDVTSVFINQNLLSVLFLIVIVVMVHITKALRLYLALYDTGISLREYLKIYCKVTPVSIILPFKTGEFFRMYCYGYAIKDYLKGFVTVLLDRFMDTLALITVLFFISIFFYNTFSRLFILFSLFLFILFIIYITFSDLYTFWNKKLLLSKATERNIKILKIINRLNIVYKELSGVLKGRGILMYFLSILAWSIEILNILFMNKFFANKYVSVLQYLNSAIGNTKSPELSLFVIISLIILGVLYIILKIRGESKCKS